MGCLLFQPEKDLDMRNFKFYEMKHLRNRIYEGTESLELYHPDASNVTLDDFSDEINRMYPDEESVPTVPSQELESYRHAKYGIVKVVDRGEMFFVPLGDRGLAGYFSLAEAKVELRNDYHSSYEYRRAEEQREEQEEIENERRVKESYRGFLDDKTPMQIGRIREHLEEVRVRNKIGKPVSYKDLIDEYAKDGVLEITHDPLAKGNRKWFLSMKGSTKGYYVGKIVADYAEYLLDVYGN